MLELIILKQFYTFSFYDFNIIISSIVFTIPTIHTFPHSKLANIAFMWLHQSLNTQIVIQQIAKTPMLYPLYGWTENSFYWQPKKINIVIESGANLCSIFWNNFWLLTLLIGSHLNSKLLLIINETFSSLFFLIFTFSKIATQI